MPIIQMTTVVKGTPAPFTLDKAALRSLVPTTSFYYDMANWSKVVLHYLSAQGKQRTFVIFDASGEIPSAPFFISGRARPVFDINAIVIEDFDGGAYLVPKTDLTISEFKVDLTASEPALEVGTPDVSLVSGFAIEPDTTSSSYYIDVSITKTGLDYDYSVTTFEIYRDTMLVANIGPNQQTYRDYSAVQGATHQYQVIARVGSQISMVAGTAEFVPPEPIGTPDISFASGTENGTFYVDVMITKIGLDYDYNVTTFDIYRDQLGMGSFFLATIGPNQQTYRDLGAATGASIEYQVIAKIGSYTSSPGIAMYVDGGGQFTDGITRDFAPENDAPVGWSEQFNGGAQIIDNHLLLDDSQSTSYLFSIANTEDQYRSVKVSFIAGGSDPDYAPLITISNDFGFYDSWGGTPSNNPGIHFQDTYNGYFIIHNVDVNPGSPLTIRMAQDAWSPWGPFRITSIEIFPL
jgi:hypothetical protein